jgi:DHA2 family multidrug resistance protein
MYGRKRVGERPGAEFVTAEVRSAEVIDSDSGDRITTHPAIGVAAVLFGTVNSVLADRLTTIALPDLRGVLGIGIDEASWLPTAINGAQMFMGPISIALAAIFGHRKVLLISCVIFILSSLVAPLVPDWRLVLIFQIIRGLSSGTFYPLTLSFVVRGLPRPWVTFGVAAYAMDVLGSNHLSFCLYGFYSEHASWHWVFWNSVIITTMQMICIYFGMPVQKPLPEYHKMHFGDFIYGSAGLTFLYVALDQGERTDWLNYGLVNGLFVSGVIMLLFAAIRRFRRPNPLIDFRLLMRRNILLLPYLLTVYRVSLLGTIMLIPRFLIGLQAYRPLELTPLALVGGLAAALVAPVMGVALRIFDIRVLAAIGLALTGLAFFGQAHVLSTWLRQDFMVWQVVLAIGHPIAFAPLISVQLFSNLRAGQRPSRVRSYTNGVYFQTIRLFATQAGASVLQRFLLWREHFWQTKLVSHVNGTWQTAERLSTFVGAMIPNAPGLAPAGERALRLLTDSVWRQAETLAIADGFMVLGCFLVSAVFIVALLRPVSVPGSKSDTS